MKSRLPTWLGQVLSLLASLPPIPIWPCTVPLPTTLWLFHQTLASSTFTLIPPSSQDSVLFQLRYHSIASQLPHLYTLYHSFGLSGKMRSILLPCFPGVWRCPTPRCLIWSCQCAPATASRWRWSNLPRTNPAYKRKSLPTSISPKWKFPLRRCQVKRSIIAELTILSLDAHQNDSNSWRKRRD